MTFSEEDAAAFVEANRHHINRLRRTIANLVTARHILHFYERLEGLKIEHEKPLLKSTLMDAEALITTIVISYGRLFSESTGTTVLKKKLVPKCFLVAHDEIIMFRNERYAHHGKHNTTAAEVELFIMEDEVEMKLHWRASMYNGAPSHWRELFEWLDEFLRTSFKKQMDFLSTTSGKTWLPFDPIMDTENITLEEADNLTIGKLFGDKK